MHYNADLNKNVSSLLLKTPSVVEARRSPGRLFHKAGAEEVKDLSPSVGRIVSRGTSNNRLLPYLLDKAPPPIKRRPQLSAAYESENIKERHPRISAAFIHNNAAPNRSIIRLTQCWRSQTNKQVRYNSI